MEGYSCLFGGRGRAGGDPTSCPDLDLSPLPPLALGIPFTLTHIHVSPPQSESFADTLLLQTATPNLSVHLAMTHCTTEAKAACPRAVVGLVRALRSRLKALRRLLLLAGSDGSRRRQAQTVDGSLWERPGLLKRETGGTVLGCCGPAHTSLTVSSPECVRSPSGGSTCVCVCVCVCVCLNTEQHDFFIFVDLQE